MDVSADESAQRRAEVADWYVTARERIRASERTTNAVIRAGTFAAVVVLLLTLGERQSGPMVGIAIFLGFGVYWLSQKAA